MKLNEESEGKVREFATNAFVFTRKAAKSAEIDLDHAAKYALVALAHIEACKLMKEIYD